jgi:hypothetical protein
VHIYWSEECFKLYREDVGFEVFTAVVLKSIFRVPLNALHGVISQKKILFYREELKVHTVPHIRLSIRITDFEIIEEAWSFCYIIS